MMIIPGQKGISVGKILKLSILAVIIAACQANPSQRLVIGEVLTEADFSESYDWENYTNLDQHVDFRIEDGVYRARAWDDGFMWVLNVELHTDVVIQVDTLQYSDYRNNAYGVVCRAAPGNNGDGYYFMISADGMYTIRRGATDEVKPLIPWTGSGAIHQDKGVNRIRAVCIGDYLALYVNGQFVAETYDDRYQRGNAGLTAAVPEGGDVDVAFDDLTIWEASFAR
jgi:hypothetical protein